MGQDRYDVLADGPEGQGEKEFQASGAEEAREIAQEELDQIAPGEEVVAVVNERTGEETDF